MPGRLNDYFRHLTNVEARKGRDGLRPEAADHLPRRSAALLRARTGHDFSGYKDKTVHAGASSGACRCCRSTTCPTSSSACARSRSELDALLQDLLIGVTSFFRDPEAFEALERRGHPEALRGQRTRTTRSASGCPAARPARKPIRSPSCCASTRQGSAAPSCRSSPATSTSSALEIARTGRFPAASPRTSRRQRLEHFFVTRGRHLSRCRDLREICLFSSHNLLRDPPFSKLDLISCRNLLIYMDAELQEPADPAVPLRAATTTASCSSAPPRT